jgi:hypothetical protein
MTKEKKIVSIQVQEYNLHLGQSLKLMVARQLNIEPNPINFHKAYEVSRQNH